MVGSMMFAVADDCAGEPCPVRVAWAHIRWIGAVVRMVLLELGDVVASSSAAVARVCVKKECDVEFGLGEGWAESADSARVHLYVAGSVWWW